MNILFDLGISENNLKAMLNSCPNIANLSKDEIRNKINILESIGCNKKYIKNIIISNPFYLDRMDDDILKLIKKLLNLGFETIDILFDSNPEILNIDDNEIDMFVSSEIKKGKNIEQIVNELSSNPFLFNEI